MRRALALLVAASLLAAGTPTARGEEAPVYTAPQDPPAKAADLTWRGPTRESAGVWLTEKQRLTVGERYLKCQGMVEQLTSSEARCQVALATARGDKRVPSWVWIGIGAVGGLALGYVGGYAAGLAR